MPIPALIKEPGENVENPHCGGKPIGPDGEIL